MFGSGQWWGMDFLHTFDGAYPHLPNAGKVALISIMLWTVLSITLHELAHGWVAIRCGDDTPRLLGHMTADPIKHMGIMGIVAFVCTGYAWGMMPVNASNLRRKHDDALVSLAGPFTNAAIALACLCGLGACLKFLSGNVHDYGVIVFLIGFSQNVRLMIFNLFPVPPLDGSRALASFVPGMRDFVYTQGANIAGLIFVMTVAPKLIDPAEDWVVNQAMDLLHTLGCY